MTAGAIIALCALIVTIVGAVAAAVFALMRHQSSSIGRVYDKLETWSKDLRSDAEAIRGGIQVQLNDHGERIVKLERGHDALKAKCDERHVKERS